MKRYENEYGEEIGPVIQGNLITRGRGPVGGLRANGLVAGVRHKKYDTHTLAHLGGKRKKSIKYLAGKTKENKKEKLEKECLGNIANILEKYYIKIEELKGDTPELSLNTLKGAIKHDEEMYRKMYNEYNEKPKKKRALNAYNKIFGYTSRAFKKYIIDGRSPAARELRSKIYQLYKEGVIQTEEDVDRYVESFNPLDRYVESFREVKPIVPPKPKNFGKRIPPPLPPKPKKRVYRRKAAK